MPSTDRFMDGLVELLAGADLTDGDLDARLDQALTGARDLLGGSCAGLMLLSASGELERVGATNAAAAALESAQAATGEGPGLEATKQRKVVFVTDIRHDTRWPTLAERLLGNEVRAVLAAPIWLRGRPAGNLNLMCTEPRDWSRADAQALSAYAGIITALLRIALDASHRGPVIDTLRVGLREA